MKTRRLRDYCSDNLIYKGLFEWIANMEEEFITGVLHRYSCIIEKKVLVMVPARSILLILLRVKSQDLEYRRRWWGPFIEKQWLYTLEYRRRWWGPFPDKQLALGYREKWVVESILSKSSAWWELVKIAS